MEEKTSWKKYLIVFLLTFAVFLAAIGVSSFFNNKKIASLKSIENNIATDILSSEVQYSLLEEQSCSDVKNSSVLSDELGNFADRIEYGERNGIGSDEDIIALKKNYSLLEIKDYLLMKRISARCGLKSSFILYFYADSKNCEDCNKQSMALTALRAKYPTLRVYSFDYNLDLAAIKALISVYKIPDTLPAIVINEKTYNGLQEIEAIDKIIGPALTPKETKAQTKTVAPTATVTQ